MDCPNCGSEVSERAAFCTQCGASLPKRPGRARSFFKWGGIGCGSLLGLFIVVVIVAALTTDTPSSDEQDTSARSFVPGTPPPATQTVTEALLAGNASGEYLRAAGHEFGDDFVQEALYRAESEISGKSGTWIVANSDIYAVCGVLAQTGEARARGEDARGEEPTSAELDEILREELGLKGAALMGAILGGTSEAVVDFCAPIRAYGIGFVVAFEATAELFGLDPSDAPAQRDIAIDEVSRTELRADPKAAYSKGFLAGMDAAGEIGPEDDTSSSLSTSELNIRFVGAADLTDQSKSSLAEVIERIQGGVVRVTAGSGSGSGFIIDESGMVVTNEHVVRGQRKVSIWLTNGTQYSGEVLSRDSTADLALVQIESNDRFHAIAVGNPAGVRVGDEVLALGFPLVGKFGNSLTVTRSIVSSIRTVNGVDLLQTDAAINPGNSGGPLIDRDGNVIGVNSFRIEETTSGRPVASIGFAVSVIELQPMVPSLSGQPAQTPSRSVHEPTMPPTPTPPAVRTPSSDAGIAIDSISAESPNISSSVEHTCILRLDGTPVCWGNRPFRRATPPPGEVFASISSGRKHICGVRQDGTVVCWGWNDDQVQTPAGDRLVSISSGDSHVCGLRKDGTVVCWGYAGLSVLASVPDEPLATISSGSNHTCALRLDGTPVCWGLGPSGQASPPRGEKFVSISSGSDHTCALRPDGSPVCWGSGFYGQASPPKGKFTSISSGGGHTCALRSDGSPVCWGSNGFGQA